MAEAINFDQIFKGVVEPGKEPKKLFKEAYEGTITALSYAEILLNQAIRRYGSNCPVGYPDTAYFLPVIRCLSGEEIRTLADCVPVLNRMRAAVKEEKNFANARKWGEATWYAADIIEAVRYLRNTPEKPLHTSPWTGFIGDPVVRQYGTKMVDWTIPGEAVIVGRARDSKYAKKIVDSLMAKGLMLFLSDEIIEQLLEENVKLGIDYIAYPLGNFTQVVHAANYALRAGMMFGGIKPGDYDAQRDYQRRRVLAFILYLGEPDMVKTAACMGAINVGFPDCWEVFRASICKTDCALRHTMEKGSPILNKAITITNSAGKKVPISICTGVLKDSGKQIIGGVETFRDLSLVEELRKELKGRYTFADIISKNNHIQQIFRILPDIADSESTVLIEGPTGSGKELFARAIHNLSRRRGRPLVAVNCAALPDTLLESELFGYVAGAFTDARRDKPGLFARASGGTILLDEIGDITPALQVKLLRVLQEKEYEPLGSTTIVKSDVRVLASTNRSLDDLVAQGVFRHDLYYRINVIRLTLPPLSGRKEDIPLLAGHFIERFNNLRERDVEGISEEALAVLMQHNFPGNVRELENIIEHAFVLCRKGLIFPRHLPAHLQEKANASLALSNSRTLPEMESKMILEALVRNNWNRSLTATELGINKSTLWRKMKKLKESGLLNNI